MGYKFDKAIVRVTKIIEIADKERAIYIEDSETIANRIAEVLHEHNSIFAKSFKNLKATASYSSNYALVDFPDDFTIYLYFELPFDLIPEISTRNKRIVYLKCYDNDDKKNEDDFEQYYPMIEDCFLNGDIFSDLLHEDLQNTIMQLRSVYCPSGRIYALDYSVKQFTQRTVFHTLSATHKSAFGHNACISFDFVPAFIFPITKVVQPTPSLKKWNKNAKMIIYYQSDSEINAYTFLYVIPPLQQTQRTITRSRFVLCLIQRLAMVNGFEDMLTAAVIKSAYNWRIQMKCYRCFKRLSSASIFMQLLEQVRSMIADFVRNALKNCGMGPMEKIKLYHSCAQFDYAYNKLLYFQDTENIDYKSVFVVFGA